MKRAAQFVLVALLTVGVCLAADKPVAAPATPDGSAAKVIFVATLRNGFSIRFDHREQRDQVSRLYLGTDSASYVDVPTADISDLQQEEAPVVVPAPAVAKPAPPPDIPTAIEAASDRHGIDADLLYSVIRAESDFNPHAVSPKGAQGLMQLMPGTADKLGVSNAFDPSANVEAGTRYLRELLDRYHYDLVKALAAYNAGPARVDQYHGVPPYAETRAYVARIVREYNKAIAKRKAAAAKKQSPVASRRTPEMSLAK